MREIARAKLNLALHVLGRRDDGYHDLDTLFAFVEDGDVLTAEPAESLSLEISGPFGKSLDGEADNLVLRAARAVQAHFGVGQGARLTLEKRLPVAAGLGGGSADAGAALRLLPRLWGIDASDEALLRIAATLGADVPACFLSRTARGTGRGDRLRITDGGLAGSPVLLVNPRKALATADVFARWSPPGSGALPDDPCAGGNDLQATAIALEPAVGEVLSRLEACPGMRFARMSGSGATCFALFRDQASRDRANEMIACEQSVWWRLATRLV